MLDKSSYKLLVKFYKCESVRYASVKKLSQYKTLCKAGLVCTINDNGSYLESTPLEDLLCAITVDGRAYVESHRKETMRYWIPIVISVAALVISIIALLKQ